jgi:internalin A
MEPPSKPRKPWYRRLSFRISVRGMIVLVLIIGSLLGWLGHRARVQREAVAAIEAAGGRVNYQWAISGSPIRPRTSRQPWNWLLKTLGTDLVCNVISVTFHHKDSAISKQPIDDALMAKVGTLGHLKTFQLGPWTNNKVTSQGLAELGRLKKLTELDLSLNEPIHFDFSFLVRLKTLESLQLLRLAVIHDDDLAHLEGLTKLRRLTIFPAIKGKPSINDAGLAHLAGLTELRSLQLDCTQIKGPGLAYLSRMTRLEHLSIELTRVESLDTLPSLPSLKGLAMNQTPITDQGLASIERFPDLTFLTLQGTAISDVGLAHLSRLKKLKSLDLGRTKVSDTGLSHFAGHPGLESITLWLTDVSDTGANSLASCPKLGRIILWDTKVTDAGLAKLAAMSSMTDLDLARTPVTNQGQATAARPGLRISR